MAHSGCIYINILKGRVKMGLVHDTTHTQYSSLLKFWNFLTLANNNHNDIMWPTRDLLDRRQYTLRTQPEKNMTGMHKILLTHCEIFSRKWSAAYGLFVLFAPDVNRNRRFRLKIKNYVIFWIESIWELKIFWISLEFKGEFPHYSTLAAN